MDRETQLQVAHVLLNAVANGTATDEQKAQVMEFISKPRPCAHQFDDWSNETVKAPFNVCRHCGQVEGSEMRIGNTVAEFRDYMAKHGRT